MMQANPYQAPYAQSSAVAAMAPSGGGEVPSSILDTLRATKPWARFLAILGFIGTGFLVLGGLAIASGSLKAQVKLPDWIGFIYVVFAFLYLAPAIFLNGYASAIDTLLRDGTMRSLDAALRQQKSFWRFVGWMALLTVVLYAVIFVVAIVAAAANSR